MIKFKNIIRKAQGHAGHAGAMASLLMGARTAVQEPPKAAPESETAPPAAEEPQETAAEVAEKIASAEPAAARVERQAVPPETEPAADVISPQTESPEVAAALDEHPTPAPSVPEEPSLEITDQLTDSVLDDIFPDGDVENDAQEPSTETLLAPEKDAPVDSGATPQEMAAEMEGPLTPPEPQSPVATDEPPAQADDSAPAEPVEAEKSTGQANSKTENASEVEQSTEDAVGETEDASGTGSVTEDVDRLLAELGQLATPDATAAPTDQSPTEEAAEGAPSAAEPLREPQPDEAFAQALTDEEKEALFAEDSSEETFDTDALVDTITAEVDQALSQEQSGPPPEASGEAEIELDFSAEAVGFEQESGAQDARQEDSDVEDLLSKVLEDLDKLGTIEKPPAPPTDQDKDENDDTFERMLRDDSQPDEDDPASSSPAQSSANDADAVPPDAPKSPPAENNDELSEDEIVTQALEETLGKDPAGGTSDDDSDNDEPSPPGDAEKPVRKDGDGGDSNETEDVDMLLANLEATMEAPAKHPQADSLQLPQDNHDTDLPDMPAAAEEDPPASPLSQEEREENLIQQEVLSRSKDVEQAVLDQLFGSDTEQFSEDLKADLELIDQDHGKEKPAASASPLGSPPPGENVVETEPQNHPDRKTPEFSKNVRFALRWLAYQMNRPFARWLNPARRKLLGAFSLGLMCTGFFWLAAVLMLRIVGR